VTETKTTEEKRPEGETAVEGEKKRRFFLNWPVWAARLLKMNSRLTRTRVIGFPDLEKVAPIIMAVWHQNELATLPLFACTRGNILISQSKDGEILARAVSALGYTASRGSSSRGGLGGILALKQSLERGENVVFAADGPRGPFHVAKPGAVYLAAKTGRPIYPVGGACSFCLCFKNSWSKSRLPLPGGRLVVVYGEPLFFPPEAARWPAYQQSRILGAAISDAVRSAEKELENWNRS